MRELKFRAWDASTGEMYMPDFIDEDGHPATFAKYDPGQYLDIWERHPVMQYTGLKDKNGKDIYEGDIVSNKIVLVTPQKSFDDRKPGQEMVKISRVIWGHYSDGEYVSDVECWGIVGAREEDYSITPLSEAIRRAENNARREKEHGHWHGAWSDGPPDYSGGGYEVIGNIYENHELLDKTEKI